MHGHGQDPGQRGPDHEPDLVQGGVEGQGGAQQFLVLAGQPRPAGPGQRSDLRDGEPGGDGECDAGGRRQPAEDGRHEGEEHGGVGGAGEEQDGAVAAPVGEPADDGAAEGLAQPEGGGDGGGVADAVALIDEQERSDGAQRCGQAGEERVEGRAGPPRASTPRKPAGGGAGDAAAADSGRGGWADWAGRLGRVGRADRVTDNLHPHADPPVSPARAVARCRGPYPVRPVPRKPPVRSRPGRGPVAGRALSRLRPRPASWPGPGRPRRRGAGSRR